MLCSKFLSAATVAMSCIIVVTIKPSALFCLRLLNTTLMVLHAGFKKRDTIMKLGKIRLVFGSVCSTLIPGV